MKRPEYSGEPSKWVLRGNRILCEDCERYASYQAEYIDAKTPKEVYLCNWHMRIWIFQQKPIHKVFPMPKYKQYRAQLKKWIETQSPESTPQNLF